MAKETKKTKLFTDLLRHQYAAEVVPYVAGVKTRKGVCDRWLWLPGHWKHGMWVEFKDRSTPIEAHQIAFQMKCNKPVGENPSWNAITCRFTEEDHQAGWLEFYAPGIKVELDDKWKWTSVGEFVRLIGGLQTAL